MKSQSMIDLLEQLIARRTMGEWVEEQMDMYFHWTDST